MACLIAPAVEAIAVTVIKKVVEKREKKALAEGVTSEKSSAFKVGLSLSRKLGWLSNLLWGGVLLLALEHLWHGEIVLYPPFLTAMINPADIAPMLQEIAIVGTSMSVFITLVWAVAVLVADKKARSTAVKAQKSA